MNLEELHSKLKDITMIKVNCAEGFADYSNTDEVSLHAAGFDAFITGSCYYMISKLEGAENVLEDFKNKIRIGTNRLFISDFTDFENDYLVADVPSS